MCQNNSKCVNIISQVFNKIHIYKNKNKKKQIYFGINIRDDNNFLWIIKHLPSAHRLPIDIVCKNTNTNIVTGLKEKQGLY